MRRSLIASLAMAGAVAMLPAAAHHSTAMFDFSKTVELTGTIKSFQWTNPHTWTVVTVAGNAKVAGDYGLEGMSPNYLARRGWTKTTVKPGDTITVTFRPMRDGSHGGMFMNGKLSTGQVLSMSGLKISQ